MAKDRRAKDRSEGDRATESDRDGRAKVKSQGQRLRERR